MSNRRSKRKLEEKAARQYAFKHSVRTTGQRMNIIEVKETVYIGTAEELAGAVLAIVAGERTGMIPEIPQGLILSDSRGEGFYDVQVP